MVVLSLFIMNKSGGLIYHRNFNSGLQSLSANDYLVLAGTFHGVHAITSLINPVKNTTDAGTRGGPPRGLEVMESEMFRMQCFQTLTGIKFLVFTEPGQPNVDVVCKKIYEIYADFVMKNPFYQIEMPIRCEQFDRELGKFLKGKQ